MEPYAKIIADSISPAGHRLTTFEVRFHRFVLAEFNTHRVFSRNSASSRAIPLSKQLEKVTTDPAMPLVWPAEQKGMQGGDEIENVEGARGVWQDAANDAASHAETLGVGEEDYHLGVHKSIANRLLEPFLMHTVVVTATAWDNFFGLRCNPMAQPEIRVAAEMMEKAYRDSVPALIDEGMWHLPYIDRQDITAAEDHCLATTAGDFGRSHVTRLLVQMSSARCARVSYETQDGKRDPAEDVSLYTRLTSADPMHASPLEHVATPDPYNQHTVTYDARITASGEIVGPRTLTLPKYGNLLGWHQHRFDVEAERGYQAYA